MISLLNAGYIPKAKEMTTIDNWQFFFPEDPPMPPTTNITYPTTLKSESGIFRLDERGYVYNFEPTADNPFVEETVSVKSNYHFETTTSIKTFIVPEGVKGFVHNFLYRVRVLERFELPQGLQSIGTNSSDLMNAESCVFANCILPTVKLPDTLQEIGIFAFGHTHIEALFIPESLKSPYGRQFKDSYIGTLYLPKAWEGNAYLDKYGSLETPFNNFGEERGWLRWYSTKIGALKFY